LFLGAPGLASAQAGTGTVRVALAGSDVPGCGAAPSPCASLQYAIEQFPLPGTGTVLVAAGTYTSSQPGRVARITRRDITVQGGFDQAFAAADPIANSVTIDGENARRGFLVDCPVGVADPCRFALSGVTITRGAAPPDPGLLDAFGGAIDAYLATIELTDVAIVANQARGLAAASGVPGNGSGGGLSFRSTDATLTRVRVEGNAAVGGDGSGTAVRGGLAVGGGIFSYESTVSMTDVIALDNSAVAGDAPAGSGFTTGAQRADGLGGFWALIYGSASVENLRAERSRAEGGLVSAAGGLGLGGAIFFQFVTSASIERALLHDNEALGGFGDTNLGGGGAIFAEDAVVSLDRAEIVGNRAHGAGANGFGGTGGGGGVYMNSVTAQDTSLAATNTVIGRNAVLAGAGSPAGYAFGGGAFLQCPQSSCQSEAATENSALLVHVTLADNSVSGGSFNQGSALYAQKFSSITSQFGIISGHLTPPAPGFYAGEAVLALGATSFERTLWHDNTTPVTTALGGTFADVNPSGGSPDFLDPAATPPIYRVGATSAARDRALGSATPIDLDGEPRPDSESAISDLGADEFTVPEPEGCALAALVALGLLRRSRTNVSR
jgi:hypothetical protein